MTCFIAVFALLQGPGTELAISPRYACIGEWQIGEVYGIQALKQWEGVGKAASEGWVETVLTLGCNPRGRGAGLFINQLLSVISEDRRGERCQLPSISTLHPYGLVLGEKPATRSQRKLTNTVRSKGHGEGPHGVYCRGISILNIDGLCPDALPEALRAPNSTSNGT